jgi:hypothetical protein
MAPVVRVEPNGSQDLLSHNDVVDDLTLFGWVKFVHSLLRVLIWKSHRIFPRLLTVQKPK